MAVRRGSRSSSRGNAMIEFILVLPLLLTILLGAVDWGFYFMVRETVINATREGARVGSVAVDSTAALSDATSAVETYLRNALGADYQRTPAVALTTISGSTAIEVRLQDFPVVPGRPGASITGLGAWTRVPTAVTAETNMRLESP